MPQVLCVNLQKGTKMRKKRKSELSRFIHRLQKNRELMRATPQLEGVLEKSNRKKGVKWNSIMVHLGEKPRWEILWGGLAKGKKKNADKSKTKVSY